jgi:hypothetical protein
VVLGYLDAAGENIVHGVAGMQLCEELLFDILDLDLEFSVYLHLVGEQFQVAAEVNQSTALICELELGAPNILKERLAPCRPRRCAP